MELYVEQMEAITELLKAINAWEKRYGAEILIDQPITVRYGQDSEALRYGALVDAIGGEWAFRPAERGAS